MKSGILSAVIFTSIFLFFSSIFYLQNLKKGSFYADEPILVEMSWFRNRTIPQIFKDAAWRAQPPLEFIIREKLYSPFGLKTSLVRRFPEMYQRALSLFWWLIPISLFAFRLKSYSGKNKLIILTSFILLGASDFMGFYLTETKHYSAIAAIFFTMILLMLSDKAKIQKWGNLFLITAAVFPLLHIVSFPYYVCLVLLFILYYGKAVKKEKFLKIIAAAFVYFALVFIMYLAIQQSGLAYQHPGLNNLKQIEYFNAHLKWTLDWIFYGTPLYALFKIIPGLVVNNLFPLFILAGIPIAIYAVRKVILSLPSKSPTQDVTVIFPVLITLIWPLTVAAVFYQSALFGGERYSIVILVITMFFVSTLIVKVANKIISNGELVVISVIMFSFLIGCFGLVRNFKYWRPKVATAETIFIRDNPEIINNADNIIVSDMGAYTQSVQVLSELTGAVFNAKYLFCPMGLFQKNGNSILNDWITRQKNKGVYFLSSGQPLNPENKVVWRYQYLTLYKLSRVDENLLCNDQNRLGNCYERCTKGEGLSDDRLRFPHTTPFIDNKDLKFDPSLL